MKKRPLDIPTGGGGKRWLTEQQLDQLRAAELRISNDPREVGYLPRNLLNLLLRYTDSIKVMLELSRYHKTFFGENATEETYWRKLYEWHYITGYQPITYYWKFKGLKWPLKVDEHGYPMRDNTVHPKRKPWKSMFLQAWIYETVKLSLVGAIGPTDYVYRVNITTYDDEPVWPHKFFYDIKKQVTFNGAIYWGGVENIADQYLDYLIEEPIDPKKFPQKLEDVGIWSSREITVTEEDYDGDIQIDSVIPNFDIDLTDHHVTDSPQALTMYQSAFELGVPIDVADYPYVNRFGTKWIFANKPFGPKAAGFILNPEDPTNVEWSDDVPVVWTNSRYDAHILFEKPAVRIHDKLINTEKIISLPHEHFYLIPFDDTTFAVAPIVPDGSMHMFVPHRNLQFNYEFSTKHNAIVWSWNRFIKNNQFVSIDLKNVRFVATHLCWNCLGEAAHQEDSEEARQFCNQQCQADYYNK